LTYRVHAHQRLSNALSYGEFRVFYQPVVDLQTGAVVGAEALLRWTREDGTIARPAEFLGVAEETGLMIPIGRFASFQSNRNEAAIANCVGGGIWVVPGGATQRIVWVQPPPST